MDMRAVLHIFVGQAILFQYIPVKTHFPEIIIDKNSRQIQVIGRCIPGEYFSPSPFGKVLGDEYRAHQKQYTNQKGGLAHWTLKLALNDGDVATLFGTAKIPVGMYSKC